MGAILDLTEKLKEPSGIIGLIILIAVIYFFVKWVLADDSKDSDAK